MSNAIYRLNESQFSLDSTYSVLRWQEMVNAGLPSMDCKAVTAISFKTKQLTSKVWLGGLDSFPGQTVISLNLGQIASNCMITRNLAAVYQVVLVPLRLTRALQKQTPNRHQIGCPGLLECIQRVGGGRCSVARAGFGAVSQARADES